MRLLVPDKVLRSWMDVKVNCISGGRVPTDELISVEVRTHATRNQDSAKAR